MGQIGFTLSERMVGTSMLTFPCCRYVTIALYFLLKREKYVGPPSQLTTVSE